MTIDIEELANVTGGTSATSKAGIKGFQRGFDDAASFCPPAGSPAGWSCRLAAGRGGAMAATDNGRWIRQ